MLGKRLDGDEPMRLVNTSRNLLDGLYWHAGLDCYFVPVNGPILPKTADNKVMHGFAHVEDASPFLGTMQPDLGAAESLRYSAMTKRRSKSEQPPTLIRSYLADNIATLRDRKYAGDERLKSVTARNRQLAADTDKRVSKNQIDRILDQSQGTTVDRLEWLAEALGVRPQDLVTPYFARGAAVTPINTTPRRKKA